eukprot:2487838-Amphidinium_carterae.1
MASFTVRNVQIFSTIGNPPCWRERRLVIGFKLSDCFLCPTQGVSQARIKSSWCRRKGLATTVTTAARITFAKLFFPRIQLLLQDFKLGVA